MFDAKELPPGRYRAKCREKSMIAAVCNGHSPVFPEADCVLTDKRAEFYKDGKPVWACNATYAAANFEMTPTE